MNIYTSATLTKVLLGIAGAGALFVAPVKAEPASTRDTAEAISEAPPASAEVPSSASGAEQLMPLAPPSVPVVDPGDSTEAEQSPGAAQLEPVAPASSVEQPAVDPAGATVDEGSIEATESTAPVDGTTEEATPSAESEVAPEDSAPLTPDAGAAKEEVSVEEEVSIEEEDPSTEGLEAVSEDESADDPAAGSLEETAPVEADPLLSGEDETSDEDITAPTEISPPEETEMSPSSALPGAAQLMAQDAGTPEEPAPAPPETAPVEETPSPGAPTSGEPVSDEELKQFASTVPGLRTIEESTQAEIAQVIQSSGFDEARFSEIYQSQKSPDSPTSSEVTEEEQQSFTKALADIQAIEEKSVGEQEKIIQEQGLEPKRFVEILVSLREDPALLTKMQEMIPN